MASTARVQIDGRGQVTSMDEGAIRIWKSDRSGHAAHSLFAGAVDGWLPRESEALALCDDGTRPVAFQWRPTHGGVELLVWGAEEERNEAERVRRSEAQLREAQEVGGIGSWHWDVPTNQTTWSEELYRIFGRDPDKFEATYEGWLSCVHPDDLELTKEATMHSFQTGEPFRFDHRVVRPDGSVRLLHCQGAVVMGKEGPKHMYGTSQDITAQKQAEEAEKRALEKDLEVEHYRELDASRRMLINSMAHELHTPLTPMRLQLSMLRSGTCGSLNDPQSTAVDVLARNATRLEALVSDLLDVARMDGGTLQLHPEDTDVAEAVDQTIETFRSQAAAEDITIASELPDSLPIRADRGRVTQVLYNLVSNAIKFSDAGSTIRIAAKQADDRVEVSVEDQGLGLDEEQKDRLFKPFVRVHDDPDRPGNGLGLHISKGLAEAHGGTLTVESPGPGKGSTFRLVLPAEAVNVTQTTPLPQ